MMELSGQAPDIDLADDGDLAEAEAKVEAALVLAADEHKPQPDPDTGTDPRESVENALDDPAFNESDD